MLKFFLKYVEKTSLLRSRRKRLLEDFEKDEKGEFLGETFTINFRCTEDQVYEDTFSFGQSELRFG